MTDKNKWTNCDFIDYGDYRNNEAEREKWLEMRRRFIGGSDAGAFNPDSKYKSPYLLYADKKGNAKPFTGNEATRRGNLLEPVIRAETGRIIGAEIVECNYALINKDHPYMGCNLDGVIINDFEFEGKTFTAPVGFEAKTSMRGDGFDKRRNPRGLLLSSPALYGGDGDRGFYFVGVRDKPRRAASILNPPQR